MCLSYVSVQLAAAAAAAAGVARAKLSDGIRSAQARAVSI